MARGPNKTPLDRFLDAYDLMTAEERRYARAALDGFDRAAKRAAKAQAGTTERSLEIFEELGERVAQGE